MFDESMGGAMVAARMVPPTPIMVERRPSRSEMVRSAHKISRTLRTPKTRVIDAEGMTVVPGFIDARTHPAWGGISELFSINLNLRSLAEIKETIRKEAAKTPPRE